MQKMENMNDENNIADHRSVRTYFVDEAGDPNLFARRGRIIVGTEGCSRHFILGMLDIQEPHRLAKACEELREQLMRDPYFKGIPSMQADNRKTATAFHAKDDLPEVRREVFALLRRHEMRFYAVIRDKSVAVDYVRQRNQREPDYRYQPNELYDELVSMLFAGHLHEEDAYLVCFAQRGSSTRNAALAAALKSSRDEFNRKTGMAYAARIDVTVRFPGQLAELQAVDYFLWALQRLYEKGEGRYVEYLWPAFRLVNAIDEVRGEGRGVEYTQKRPLIAAVYTEKPGI